MSISVSMAVHFGLNHMGLRKIIAITSENNFKAINVLERTNFSLSTKYGNGNLEYEITDQVEAR